MLTIPRAPLWRAFACYTLLAGLDLGLTMRVLRAGGVEWNPLEAWLLGHYGMGVIFLHKALSLVVMYLGIFQVAVPLVERSGNRQWRHVPYEALCLYCVLACIPVVGALGAMVLLAR